MSKQLKIAASLSVAAMALFALVAQPSAPSQAAGYATGAAAEATAPALQSILPAY